jgi:Na+/melibiose symporter-like transporter
MHNFDYELIFILIIIIFLTLFYITEFKNSVKNIYYLIFYSDTNLNNKVLSESIKRI